MDLSRPTEHGRMASVFVKICNCTKYTIVMLSNIFFEEWGWGGGDGISETYPFVNKQSSASTREYA